MTISGPPVVVTMLHTADYAPAEVSVPAAERYCARAGYRFTHFRGVLSQTRHPAWSKIDALAAVAADCAEGAIVVWCDADLLLFGSQPLDPLLPAGADLAFSQDFNGLCSGFFAMRTSSWALGILAAVASAHEEQFPWEQKVFKRLLGDRGERDSRVALIPESVIQNPYSRFCPSASGMHFWAHLGGHTAIVDYMRRIESLGWLAAGPSQTGHGGRESTQGEGS